MERFFKMVENEKKTIIITTHYIEEARRSDAIGLMRGGVLIAEDSPDVLLERYNCVSLESVFLKLSEIQSNQEVKLYPTGSKSTSKTFDHETHFFNKRRFKAQIFKSYMRFKGNVFESAFVTFIPAMVVFLLFMIGTENSGNLSLKRRHFSVVNDDANCSDGTRVALSRECQPTLMMSCRFVEIVKGTFSIYEGASLEDGINDVYHGRASGVIYFRQNFSKYVFNKITLQTSSSNEVLEKSNIQIWMDKSERPFVTTSEKEFMDASIKMLKEYSKNCGYREEAVDIPVNFGKYIYKSASLIQDATPGLFLCSTFYTFMLYSSTSIISDRMSGGFVRDRIAGLTIFELMLSKVIVQFIMMTLQSAISLLVLYPICHFQQNGHLALVVCSIFLVQIFGMSLGLLVGIAIRNESHVTFVIVGILLTFQMCNGGTWPTEGQHWTIRGPMVSLPVIKLIKTYINITIKGWGMALVWMSFFSAVIIIAIVILVIFLALKTGLVQLE